MFVFLTHAAPWCARVYIHGQDGSICRHRTQRRYGGPWKPPEPSDEGAAGPVVIMAGSDEPLGVADVFDIKADADSDPELVEAVTEAGFILVHG